MQSARGNEFDVAWRDGALGLRFTPNERDEPVICQVPAGSNPAVLASPAAVGDVLLGFQLSPAAPMQPVAGFDQLLAVLARAPKPVTLRFRSRERDAPEPMAPGDRLQRYEFTWAPGAPLGVSLAMDPCSLHAAITFIDEAKISPAFRELRPVPGDVLTAISGAGQTVALDVMRFEDVIRTLRAFPRPCQLVFARFQADDSDDDGRARAPSKGPDVQRPALTKQTNQELPVLKPLSASPPRRPAHKRMMPMWQRQSFKIDEPKATVVHAPTSSTGSPPAAAADGKHESPFYTVTYAGGAVGLHLRDCTQDDRRNSVTDRSNRTNGYSVAVREVTNASSAPGLERASAGDLLMAIGQRDLQHLSFDQVRAELARISSPTPLLFKKRKVVSSGSSATSSSLVDALMLFLV